MRIGIDATNAGSGGGIVHLKEFCSKIDLLKDHFPDVTGIIIFGSADFLSHIPENSLIVKKTYPLLNKSLVSRYIFQLTLLDKEVQKYCDLLLSLTGDYIGKFRPVIGMSRNMLLYDREIWQEINSFKEVFRFWFIYLKQKRSFKTSNGIIFISDYAKERITSQLNLEAKRKKVIHHGISLQFQGAVPEQKEISEYSSSNPFKFVYVSTVHVYKHQWNVVQAIHELRLKGYPVELYLIGGVIFEPAGKKLKEIIEKVDSEGNFIHHKGHVPHDKISNYYRQADGIIFASTCENMPNTLIEAMASGLPILCSDRAPMPEFLKENGFYFDALKVDSLVETALHFFKNPEIRYEKAKSALLEVKNYSWEKTTLSTMDFLLNTFSDNKK